MKPLKLTLCGFGPFADETVIDFEKVSENGIYLITGQTGSGKTTIFDGICYALFGQGTNGRKGKSFRSDYCSVEQKTFVKLDFIHRNLHYTVERNPEYVRMKKNGNGTTVQVAEASIICKETGLNCEGVNSVNTMVRNVLSLDYEQFVQSVMIAQNDFMRILKVSNSEREALFQKLFNTEIYSNLQKKIQQKYDNANNDVTHLKSLISEEMGNIVYIEGFEDAQMLKQLSEDSDNAEKVLSRLGNMNSYSSQNLLNMKKQNDNLLNLLNGYDERIENARDVNRKIIHRDQLKNDLLNLNLKQQQITATEKKLARANSALIAERYLNDYNFLLEKRNEIITKVKEEEIHLANHDRKVAEKEMDYLKAKVDFEQIDELVKEKQSKEEALPLIRSYLQFNQSLNNLKNNMVELFNISNQKDIHYASAKQSFYENQYGIIAQQLQDGMPCPVCGSTEHPDKAELEETAFTQEDLQKAENEKNAANKKLNDATADYQLMKGRVESVLQQLNEKRISVNDDTGILEKQIQSLDIRITNIRNEYEYQNKEYSDLIRQKEVLYDRIQQGYIDIRNLNEKLNSSSIVLRNKFNEYGFVNEKDLRDCRLTDEQAVALQKEVSDYYLNTSMIVNELNSLDRELEADEYTDIQPLVQEYETVQNLIRASSDDIQKLEEKISVNEKVYASLKEYIRKLSIVYKDYSYYTKINESLTGSEEGRKSISFENFVQQYYFNQIIVSANRRLAALTDGRYMLRGYQPDNVETDSYLMIHDESTDSWRDVSTLSGGESFITALSLSLALSQAVSERNGSVIIDAIFIDEGFGSLDEKALNQAISVLKSLAGKDMTVGVISHVSELKNRIENRISVRKTNCGSTVDIIV